MKVTLLVLSMLACTIATSPPNLSLRDTGELLTEEEFLLSDDIDGIAPMEFTGPITPGGPEFTLFGTAEDILNQIHELNPSYDVWAFPEYAADLEAKGFTRDDLTSSENLARSQAFNLTAYGGLEKRVEGVNCGIGQWVGQWFQCINAMTNLINLGSAWCRAPAKKCARMGCSHSCGMWLCSKMEKEKKVHCGDIAHDINVIANECIDVFGRIRGQKA
ncbi:hypothetical protein B0O99DRAFT_677837, partial [Bisporella sp. PMI_857]